MRFIKKILERGTITIPSDVREAVGVEEGDIVEFQIIRVVKRGPEPPLSQLSGVDVPPRGAPTKPSAVKNDSSALGRDL